MKKKVSVVGGGSSAHTVIPLLSKAGYEVNILTNRPESWKKKIIVEYLSETGELIETFEGTLNTASDDPAVIIGDADFILLCLPVSQYKSVLNRIAPFINSEKKVYLGTIYGQGGFNWMVDEIKSLHSLENIMTFACGLIPWICRTKKYGEIGITYGPKSRNVAAIEPAGEFTVLRDTFFNDLCYRWFQKGEFYQALNFISLSLSVDNQIIHTSRMYGLFIENPEKWNRKEDVPLFYKDYDDTSADLLMKLDDDYSKIRENIKGNNPDMDFYFMMDYLSLERFSYDSENQDIKTSFVNSKTLGLIQTPVILNSNNKWELDRNHRFFKDDFFYGLCIAKWFAENLSIEVPTIDEILVWGQSILGVPFIESGKLNKDCSYQGIEMGTPDKYTMDVNTGLTSMLLK